MPERSGKTEPPTQRRLDKARQEGQFLSAREFVAALQFLVFLCLLGLGGERWFRGFRQTARHWFALAFAGELSPRLLTRLSWELFWTHLLPLVLGGMAVVAATLVIRLGTTRFGLSLKKLAPDWKRLDPLARLRELPRQNLPALVEAAVLLPLFLGAVYVVVRGQLEGFLVLPLTSSENGARFLAASLMDVFGKPPPSSWCSARSTCSARCAATGATCACPSRKSARS